MAFFVSINAFSLFKKAFTQRDHIFYLQELVQGFDQETAAVVMARLASLKMETEVYLKFFVYSPLFGKYMYHCGIYLKWL